jgi:MFS family permease
MAANSAKIWTLYAEAAMVWLLFPGLTVGTVAYLVRTVAGDGTFLWGVFLGVATLSGSLVAVRWISDLGLGPVFGALSDKLGRSKVILTSMAVAFVALFMVALNQSLLVVIAAFVAAFLANTALHVTLNASVGELAPLGKRAAILSWYTTWADIGSGTGPVLGLPLVTMAGFGWAYGSAAALLVVAALLYAIVFARNPIEAKRSTQPGPHIGHGAL